MRFFSAIRVFFRILFDPVAAQRITAVLAEAPPSVSGFEEPAAQVKPKPIRNDAVGLLVALQREARFVDFFQEPLDGFSDAQIGAAARDVHRQTKAVLDRMFAIEPLSSRADGDTVELPADFNAAQWKLVGKVEGQPPFRGAQTHHGWKAAKCELPTWSGAEHDANVLAPIEVEIS